MDGYEDEYEDSESYSGSSGEYDEEEEADPEPLRKGEVHEDGSPSLKFSFEVAPDRECPQCLCVCTDASLRTADGYTTCGRLVASFLPLKPFRRARGGLYAYADACSDELDVICTTFFHDNGKPRFDRIDGLEVGPLPSAPAAAVARWLRAAGSAGGGGAALELPAVAPPGSGPPHKEPDSVLDIEKVQVSPEHRGRDIGLRLVRATLNWLSRPWVTNDGEWLPAWELAVIQAGFLRGHLPPEGQFAGRLEALCRHWARLGFRQAFPGSTLWYLTPERQTFRRKDEMDGVFSIVRALPAPELTDADKNLIRTLRVAVCASDDPSQPLPQAPLADAVAAGGCVRRTLLLHVAVAAVRAPRCAALLRGLLELGGALGLHDPEGFTELHVAACLGNAHAVRELLALGADRAALSLRRTTPLEEALTGLQVASSSEGPYTAAGDDDYVRVVDELLQGTPESELLVDGTLTPRMHLRLLHQAVTCAGEARDELEARQEGGASPLHSIPSFLAVPGGEGPEQDERAVVRYMRGFAACCDAVATVLQRGLLPTPVRMLAQMGPRRVERFVGAGGSAKGVLRVLVRASKAQSTKYGSGFFDELRARELAALPAVPLLDDAYEYVAVKLRRPLEGTGSTRCV